MTHPYKRPDGLWNIPKNIDAVETYDALFPPENRREGWNPSAAEKRQRVFELLNDTMARCESGGHSAVESHSEEALSKLSAVLGISAKLDSSKPVEKANATGAALFHARDAVRAAIARGDY
ncbi:hypothetical protein [Phyllobacterium sp. YR620]|uniref:hypothetical protein n=1 Tax=Phyllobacterium sp. YR620 TaxID=1881066 RepID=UPI001113676E|nr:hypothetical protein [Phyllobacterium sp. YR620]